MEEEIEHMIYYNQEYDELSEMVSEDTAILTFKILKVKKRRIEEVLLTIDKIEQKEE